MELMGCLMLPFFGGRLGKLRFCGMYSCTLLVSILSCVCAVGGATNTTADAWRARSETDDAENIKHNDQTGGSTGQGTHEQEGSEPTAAETDVGEWGVGVGAG